MVSGVVAGVGLPWHLTTTHNASGTTITRAGRPDGVFTVETTGLPGQLPLPVAKHRPVLLVGKRTSLMDESVGLLTFWRQRGQRNGGPVEVFRDRSGLHHFGAYHARQNHNGCRPMSGMQGPSNHCKTPFKSTGLTRTLRGASVMHCTKKSNSLLNKQAIRSGIKDVLSERPLAAVSMRQAEDQRWAFASATVSAVMLTMRRTVVLGVRMCTGLAAPSSTGPMAILPPAAVFSRL